ncbi:MULTISPECIES: TraB/VirB10 family protein [Stenotrophomonas]|uniref:TraB/VirB10 family protein n=1 Tax=Stenotrophomonas TaxID=40323 RepID=UPI002E77A776|nr:TraB/VirB10 family protein [Stenotrophomonas geniculata]
MGIKENLKGKFNKLPPEKKRKFVFVGAICAVVFVLAAIVIINDDPSSRQRKKKTPEEQGIGNVLMATNGRDVGLDGMGRQVQELKAELDRVKKEQSRQLSGGDPNAAPSAPTDPDQALANLVDQVGSERANIGPPGTILNRNRPAGANGTPGGQDAQQVPSQMPIQRPVQQPVQPPPAAPLTPVITTQRSKEPQISAAKARLKHVYLPTGSLMSGVLITGLDAPTGRTAQTMPIPVLARVKAEAILPSQYRSDVREAFILAAGFGDLSSERAYLRTERLSMILKNGEVIDIPIKMSAVGNDGKNGLRGRVVSKQGAVIGQALMAGMADGVSRAFGGRSSGFGRGSELPSDSEVMVAGIGGGASSALDRIAAYFLSQAEAMYPVVEVDGGREITFILLEGTELVPRGADEKADKRNASSGSESRQNAVASTK